MAEGNSQDFLEELGKVAKRGVASRLLGIAQLCRDGVLWGNAAKEELPHESLPRSLSVPKTQTLWCPGEEQGDGPCLKPCGEWMEGAGSATALQRFPIPQAMVEGFTLPPLRWD